MIDWRIIRMTWKTVLCLGAISATILFSQGTCLAVDAHQSSAYIDGTVTMIPVNTQGTLELANPESLEFRYGDSGYAIPYEQITGFRLGKPHSGGFTSHVAGGASRLGRTVLPMFFSNKKYLTVEFRADDATKTQRAVFRVPDDVASAAVPVLKEKASANRAAAKADNPDDWWGNRYWKTNRNRHLWPSGQEQKAEAESHVEVASTK